MSNKTVRCAIYDRVSTDMQVQTGQSLETQKELLTEYAQSHNYKIVGYYADEGLTARKKLKNRKDFLRLLEDIKADKIDMVLVTKLDRWFRNVRDYHNTQAVLEDHNCNWKTILEDYDTTTADGQLKINIMLAVAQNESDRTSERIKVVFDHKRRNGEHITGKPGFGYLSVNKKLQKDKNTQHIVDDIFRFYFSCFSKRKTIFYILDKYKECSPTNYQINRILNHELYAGLYHGVPGYCEPYITTEQHNTILKICSSKTYPQNKEPYLFSRMLLCPHCGSTMTGFLKKRTLKNGNVSEYKRYRCSKKFAKHEPGACLTEGVIEQYLLENVVQALQQKIYEVNSKQRSLVKKDQSYKIKEEVNRLNILFQKGRIDEGYYEEQYSKLQEKLEKEKVQSNIISVESFRHIQKQFDVNWLDIYQSLDIEHKKVFWKRCIEYIEIDKISHKVCGINFLI